MSADEEQTPPPPAETTVPTARGRRWGRWLVFGLALLSIGLVTGLLYGAWWATGDTRGTAWLLARLPSVGVQVLEPEGTLRGDFKARQVTVKAGRTLVVVESPRWKGLTLAYADYPSAWAVLHASTLQATRVTVSVTPGPPSGKPAVLPTRIRLPLEILVDETSVDELRVPGLPDSPFRQVHARVHLGADRGAQHRFDAVTARFESLDLSGQARIGATAPMALDVQVAAVQSVDIAATQLPAAGASSPPAWAKALRQGWQAEVKASGPLARFGVQASLKAKGQQLDAQAQVEPIASWPLPQLEARTVGLDLSALSPQAPATALSGHVEITSLNAARGAAGGLRLVAELTNAKPGAWSEHQLPVRSAKVDLHGRPGAGGPLDLQTFEAVLADARKDAGSVRGSGHWDARQFNLKAELAQVKPGALDTRLPAMDLSGPVTLSGQFPATPTTAPARPSGAASAPAAARPAFKVLADLNGRMTDLDRAVELKLDAAGNETRIDLRELRASAGGAQANLSGSAERSASAWQLKAKAALVEFDPRPWLPGAGNAAWAAGPHRLNLHGELALTVPDKGPADPRRSLVDRLASLRGDASVQLNQSVLAGEALSGSLSLRHTVATEPMQAIAELDLGGNKVRLEASVAPDGRSTQDRWSLDVRAPALARLAPVLKMLPSALASGLLEGLTGALTVDAEATGRWPALSLQGKASLAGLRAGPLTMSQGDLRWQLGSQAHSPVDIQVDLAQAGWGIQQFGGTRLQVKGSAQSHELSLRTEMKASPPAWMENLQGRVATPVGAALARTQASLSAQGSLGGGIFDTQAAAGTDPAPLAWKGTVQQLEVRSTHTGGAPWISTRNVGLELQGGPSPRFVMSAGRADIFTAGLRWDRIEWQPDQGVRAQALDMQAELEPLAVAPLLNRIQPDFGWNGDLKIGGKVVIKQAAEFSADIVLERVSGDLNVTDDSGTQALGLTDLVLAVNAQDGVWSFTQGLAGKQLGVAAGSFVVRTSPQRAWPDPNAPLQGVFEAKVENLGTWGAWVPAGWRLGGHLRTTASLAGHFGAPEYTGHIEGSGITVRNLLQGVNIADGEVGITLQGDTARIDKFSARAGSGTVKLTGDAHFGAAPLAQLQLTADKFQLLGRVDRRIVASGEGRVVLDRENLKVDGKFGVDEGLFDFTRADAPTLGSDVVVSGRSTDHEPAAAVAPGTSVGTPERGRNTAINLEVGLGQNLRLRGRGIDTGLQGEMRITTPGGNPSWNGSIRAVGGTYAAYGQKLVIERGVITFNGPVADPRLDIHAMRPNLDVEVGVAISGTALNPRVRLYSVPDMSDIDKLSWLMLGRASEGLGTSDTALLQRAALALLAGDNPSVTDQVLHSIGIDDVSVRQSDGEVKDTVVSLGKQLSRRWYVGYERGLNSTTGTWQLIYRIAQRFTLRAQSGLDNSLDVIWTWRWN